MSFQVLVLALVQCVTQSSLAGEGCSQMGMRLGMGFGKRQKASWEFCGLAQCRAMEPYHFP
jgi:hypothetical protein